MSRIWVLIGLVSVLIVPTSGVASDAVPGTPGVDWFRFLGPTLDAKSPEVGINKDWSTDPLPVVWQREVGEGYSAPSVARGRLFFFDRHGDQARLVALDKNTGKELWRSEYPTQYVDMYDYSGGPRASPVIDADRVFAFGAEGLLRAHSFSNGEVLWQVDTTEQFHVVQNFFGVGSTPIVEGDLLITMIGGSPSDSPAIHTNEVEGAGSGIVAFEKSSGDIRYSITNELASYSSPVIYNIGGRRWAFAFTRGGLVGFEPSSGLVEFEFPWRARKLESVNAATPILVDDAILITESYGPGGALIRPLPGKFEVVHADNPRQRAKSIAAHWSTPVFYKGYVYGSSGESSGNSDLRCIDPRTAEIQWSEKMPRATLMYVDGHFVVLTERGRMILVRATSESYSPVTEIDLGDELGFPSWNAPVLSHGLLYVRGSKNLLALELISAPRN